MKAVRRAIILCWVMLIVCFIIKLFGGNWFEIICNDEHFIFVCGFIDAHWFIKYPAMYISYILSLFFVILSCSLIKKPNIKQFFLIIGLLTISWAINFFSNIAKTIFEIVVVLILPTVLNTKAFLGNQQKTMSFKTSWFMGIIGYALIALFQVISLITRNIGIKNIGDNTLTTLILMVDYYIMVFLYYLYSCKIKMKKEGK